MAFKKSYQGCLNKVFECAPIFRFARDSRARACCPPGTEAGTTPVSARLIFFFLYEAERESICVNNCVMIRGCFGSNASGRKTKECPVVCCRHAQQQVPNIIATTFRFCNFSKARFSEDDIVGLPPLLYCCERVLEHFRRGHQFCTTPTRGSATGGAVGTGLTPIRPPPPLSPVACARQRK